MLSTGGFVISHGRRLLLLGIDGKTPATLLEPHEATLVVLFRDPLLKPLSNSA